MSPNEQKLRSLILYIFDNYNNPNLTPTKLQKLLYYCDFDYYQKNNKSITNFSYYKNRYGPTIKELPNVLRALESEGYIKNVKKQNYYGAPQTNFALLKKPEEDKTIFSDSERLTIDRVNTSYVGLSPREISTLSHIDPPYVLAKDQGKIEYDNITYRDDELDEEGVDTEAQKYFEDAKLDRLFSTG